MRTASASKVSLKALVGRIISFLVNVDVEALFPLSCRGKDISVVALRQTRQSHIQARMDIVVFGRFSCNVRLVQA